MDSFCVRCKSKQTMEDAKNSKTKNGRDCVSGKCAKCGTKMIRFVKKGEGV